MSRFKILLLASALATPALAQQTSAPDATAAANEIVVTAVRTPTPVNQVASSITVLDKAAKADASPIIAMLACTQKITTTDTTSHGSHPPQPAR